MIEVYKDFRFEAAHFLPKVPQGHPCKNMHGHSYKVTVHIKGEPDAETGWLLDFGDIKKAFAPIVQKLDHSVLNDIKGLENPTSELMAIWVWNQLKPVLPLLSKIVVSETSTSGCVYEGK
jgi:6-pyruvoyltetrahydropterin/6-carboxytetrahydropterin synthase